jgi:ABC-type uncharacterized transport system permease subunit
MTVSTKTLGWVAVSAATMSAALAVLVPSGQPWTSLAFAVLACAAAGWAKQSLTSPQPTMSDLIREIEAEAPRVSGPRIGRSSTLR